MNNLDIISYSEVFKWQLCPRQYWYKFILDRTPIKESDAIRTGIDGHKLLQKFYTLLQEGMNKEEARKKVAEWAAKEITLDSSLLKAWVLVDNYIREADFTSKAVLVEKRFLFPAHKLLDVVNESDLIQAAVMSGFKSDQIWHFLGDMMIGFTPDLVLERIGNFLDVEDYKFVQRSWSAAQLAHFSQLKLYKIFLDLMGYKVSRCVLRFFNVATGQSPLENFKDYIPKIEEETILARDFLLAAFEVYRFKKFVSPSTQAMIPKTMNYTACKFCSYSFPCALQAEGKDASKTLQIEYVGSNYDYSK